MEEFEDWLEQNIRERYHSVSEFARQAGVTHTTVNNVLNGGKPGLKFLLGTSRALNVPLEDVMRRAGLLPQETEPTPRFSELLHVARQLSDDDLDRLIAIARTLYDEDRREAKRRSRPASP